jgi:hypothetical protein
MIVNTVQFKVVSQFEFDMLDRSSSIGIWQRPQKDPAIPIN